VPHEFGPGIRFLLNICAMIFRSLNIPFVVIAIGEAFGLPSEKNTGNESVPITSRQDWHESVDEY